MRKFVLLSILFLTVLPSKLSAKVERFLLEGMEKPVYYDATKPLTDGDKGETVVVMIHGWSGGAWKYVAHKDISERVPDLYVVEPLFARTVRMEAEGIKPDGRAIWNNSWTSNLKSRGLGADDWRGGGDAEGTKMSSYDVVDRIFEILSNKKLYPNLKHIVLAGFSAGGQFVDRYVAVGKGKVRKGITLDFISMSPSSNLRMQEDVPWHYGLANRPRYSAKTSLKKIWKNLESRPVLKCCGDLDTTLPNLDQSPNAMAQGKNRYDRFVNYQQFIKAWPKWEKMVTFHTIHGIAHESVKAYQDPVVMDYIFNGTIKK